MKWSPSDSNHQADYLSWIVGFDDYTIIDDVFQNSDFKWEPHTLDRFACSYNAKLSRFKSRFYQSDAEAVGTLLIPTWKSCYFWILVCDNSNHWNAFVHYWVIVPKLSHLFMSSWDLSFSVAALYLYFVGTTAQFLSGFCLVEEGNCLLCNCYN